MLKRVIVLVAATALVLLFANARAEDIETPILDDIGVTMSYGVESKWLNPADDYDLSVKRLTLWGGKHLDEGMQWKLEAEIQGSGHKAENDSRSVNTNEFGGNLILKREFPSDTPFLPYLGLMGGLSILSNSHSQPQFDDSVLFGKFGGLIGTNIYIDNYWSIRLEYRLTHTSAPFGPDVGRNFDEFIIGIGYTF